MGTCRLFAALTLLLLSSSVSGQDTPTVDKQAILSELYNVPVDEVETATQNLFPDSTSVPPDAVKYFYYPPNSNNSILITAENASQVVDPSKNTTIIIHGWTESAKETWIVGKAYLLNKYAGPRNVIAVDWSPISKNLNYIESAGATNAVGIIVGNFILEIKLPLSCVQIDGHSLGAHVAGSAGHTLGGKLDMITAEDPAGPTFEDPAVNRKLTPEDASWIQVIHTGVPLGMVARCGSNDFYVNNVILQPNCLEIFVKKTYYGVVCSHRDSHAMNSRSLIDETIYLGRNDVTGEEAYMGHQVTRKEGVYNVTTDDIPDPDTM